MVYIIVESHVIVYIYCVRCVMMSVLDYVWDRHKHRHRDIYISSFFFIINY